MKAIKLTDHDILYENGQLSYVSDSDLKTQQAKMLLSINQGEWFLDLDLGLDYSQIQGKGITLAQAEQAFVDCLSTLDWFDYLSDFELDLDRKQRFVTYKFNIHQKEDDPLYMEGVLENE